MEKLLTADELATYLKVSKPLLAKWRSYGGGPIFIKVGGSVRYRESDVIDFINGASEHSKEAKTIETTAS